MPVSQQFSGNIRHQKIQKSIQCKFKLLKYWIYSVLSDDPGSVLTCAKGHKKGCIIYFWFLSCCEKLCCVLIYCDITIKNYCHRFIFLLVHRNVAQIHVIHHNKLCWPNTSNQKLLILFCTIIFYETLRIQWSVLYQGKEKGNTAYPQELHHSTSFSSFNNSYLSQLLSNLHVLLLALPLAYTYSVFQDHGSTKSPC